MNRYMITLWTSLDTPDETHVYAENEEEAMARGMEIAKSRGMPQDLAISVTLEREG